MTHPSSTRVDLPVISERVWNAMVDKISRRLPLRISLKDETFAHPWTVSLKWESISSSTDLRKGEWRMSISPGFVNGEAPDVDIFARFATSRTLSRLKEASGAWAKETDIVSARLTEYPRIPIPGGLFRVIGKGAEATGMTVLESGTLSVTYETIPAFFTQFLIAEPDKLSGNINSGIQSEVTPVDPASRRLCAFDIVLYVDRPALKLDASQRGTAALDGFTVLLTYTYGRSEEGRERPYLRMHSLYSPPSTETATLLDGGADVEFDAVKVATVYLLSPEGEPRDSLPDGRWTPYVKHDLFWNLAHATQKIIAPAVPTPLTVRTGLAGGLGDVVGNQILSPNNDAYAEALLALNAQTAAGRFWSI